MLKTTTYKINARTYRDALMSQLESCDDKLLKDSISEKIEEIKKEKITSWIKINPKEDENLLKFSKNKKIILVPFFNSDDVFINMLDIYDKSPICIFSTLEFSENVFKNTLQILKTNESKENINLERLGALYLSKGNMNKEEAIDFSIKVCSWGRQNRVFANLKRHNPLNYGELLKGWFNYALNFKNPTTKEIRKIISMGDEIKGLSVSFASKHLRMLNPQIFPVLDDVLAKGLGFMLNEHGYSLFINYINDFKEKNNHLFSSKKYTIAEIEMILFLLTRQFVRSE